MATVKSHVPSNRRIYGSNSRAQCRLELESAGSCSLSSKSSASARGTLQILGLSSSIVSWAARKVKEPTAKLLQMVLSSGPGFGSSTISDAASGHFKQS